MHGVSQGKPRGQARSAGRPAPEIVAENASLQANPFVPPGDCLIAMTLLAGATYAEFRQ